MRLFVAVSATPPPFDPFTALKKLKVNLNEQRTEYKWVPAQNYHITINFIGQVDPEKFGPLEGLLADVARESPPFTLKLSGVGAFPNDRQGRVIWMGVQNSIPLRELQARCSERLRAQGWVLEEKDFSPHLTLARLRSPKHLVDIISPAKNQDFGKLEVRELTLYESKLQGNFPVYIPLKRFNLTEL